MRRRGLLLALLLAQGACAATPPAAAPVPAPLPSDMDATRTVLSLPTPPSKHWVWINDFVFAHMADGMAMLVDGDTGQYLATLSTGYTFARVVLPRDGKVVYSPETYFSRGTRGTRTDVVTIYDGATLEVQGESRGAAQALVEHAGDGQRRAHRRRSLPAHLQLQSGPVGDRGRHRQPQVRRRDRDPGLRAGVSDRRTQLLQPVRGWWVAGDHAG